LASEPTNRFVRPAYVRTVLEMLRVKADIPDTLILYPGDINIAFFRRILDKAFIERSDHWIEFAMRSVPLNIGAGQ